MERLCSAGPQTVLGIILGGGAGSRLYPLTKKRAKPAVPLGANYRLIDIPVSNCINSNVNKVYCLTQFNSASLNRHLSQAYNANVGGYSSRGFVEVGCHIMSNFSVHLGTLWHGRLAQRACAYRSTGGIAIWLSSGLSEAQHLNKLQLCLGRLLLCNAHG